MFLFISGPEILFIGLIVLLVFGADKITEIAKGLRKLIRKVKDATEDIKSEIKKSAENQQKKFQRANGNINVKINNNEIYFRKVNLFKIFNMF